jgi:4-hydroxy-2-oxoglutarate aldolase
LKFEQQKDAHMSSLASALAAKLRGILVPFPTPFDVSDEVDLVAIKSNIVRWNKTGVNGYVALGSTGERVHLDERERISVIETARACVPEHLVFLVGIGEQSTRGTIADARRAAELGADGLLVITPGFYRSAASGEALFRHFSSVADASPVPIVLYSIPQNTGVAIAPELAARLAEHKNVVGIKDSSGDLLNLAEILRLVGVPRDDFAVMGGHGGSLYASVAAGASGGILAAGSAVPELCVEIFHALTAGDHARALTLQKALSPFARAVTALYGIGGLKVALDLRGYRGGSVRAPLEAPSENARREIEKLSRAAMAEFDQLTSQPIA